MSLWGKFTGWLNRNFQHPSINPPIMPVKDPGGVIDLDRLAALHARPDAVTAQQDEKAASFVTSAYQDAMKDPPTNWPSYLDRTAQAARLDALAGLPLGPETLVSMPKGYDEWLAKQPPKPKVAVRRSKEPTRKPGTRKNGMTRQPIAARKALKAVKAKKKAKRK